MRLPACVTLAAFFLGTSTALDRPRVTFAQKPAPGADKADFYVSPKGNDRWSGRLADPGASDGPFATVARAQQAVRALLPTLKPNRPVRVVLGGGTYYLDRPLEFGPEDSGAENAPVVYAAAPGEKVVLSGGRRIVGGRWGQANGRKAWIVDIPGVKEGKWNFRQLFVNGVRRPRTRLPKQGEYRIESLPGYTGDFLRSPTKRFVYAPGHIDLGWRNLRDVEVVAITRWLDNRLPIESVDGGTRTVSFDRPSLFALHSGAKPEPYWVENVFEALDASGQWYLDRPQGRLDYLPQPGEDPASAEIIAPRLTQVLRVAGRPGATAHDLRFEGITFSHTEWRPPADYASSLQAGVEVPGALVFDYAKRCAVAGGAIEHIGNCGVEVNVGCADIEISRNRITDIGAGGVRIGHFFSWETDGSGRLTERGLRRKAAMPTGPHSRRITVADNEIAHCGRFSPEAVGVFVGDNAENRIVYNHIHDLYYSGISVGSVQDFGPNHAEGNIVEHNHIHDIGQGMLSDMAGIYTCSTPGARIRYNVVYDVARRDYGGWGIYPDEGAHDILIEKNVVYRCQDGALFAHHNRNITAENNIFAFNRKAQIERGGIGGFELTCRRNLVYFTEGKAVGDYGSGRCGRDVCTFDRNLYWNASGRPVLFGDKTLAQWQATGQDTDGVVGDPLFVDPKNGDFRLRPGSPAAKIGFEPWDLSAVGPRASGAAEGPFTVNVQAGRYRLEWHRLDTAKTGEIQAGGGPQEFKAPFAEPAVLYLTRAAGSEQLRPGGNRAKQPMVFPRDDWAKAGPESQGIDPAKLQAGVDYLARELKEHGGAGTLFIACNGRAIWAGPECDRQHQIFSATKSFTSTVFGLLIDDGKVTLGTLAKDLDPALARRYPAVTLRHFATMTSGYDSVGAGYEFDRQGRGDSWNPGPPAAPLFPPGSKFRYWDDAMMQFGSLLTRAAGEPLDRLFKRRIADPIGMTRWQWTENDSAVGRVLCWTGGIHTSSRELARFGHLFLNRGNWNGRQLVSASWVDQATSVQVPASIPNDDLPRSRGAGVYGYNWWVNGVKPGGRRLWPDAPPRTYYANGLHNNVCIVVPEWNMVIARTNGGKKEGGANTPPNVDEIWSGFFTRLGEALGPASGNGATGLRPITPVGPGAYICKDRFLDADRTPAASGNSANPVARGAGGLLRVHPKNPRCFTDDSGKAIYLGGHQVFTEIQDNAWSKPWVLDWPRHLQFMKERNLNYLRNWIIFSTGGDPKNPASPMPYARIGPGTALDGGPKFDLRKFDETYFQRLHDRIRLAQDEGIVVSIMLFEVYGFNANVKDKALWDGNVFNGKNNVNGIDADPNGDSIGLEFFYENDPKLREIQRDYVKKVIDSVNDLDNVVFEIANECGATPWQHEMIDLVHECEAKHKPRRHLVLMSPGGCDVRGKWVNRPKRDVTGSRADVIAVMTAWADYKQDPPANEEGRPAIMDMDHINPGGSDDRIVPWKAFTRGYHYSIYDHPFENRRDEGPSWELARRNAGAAVWYSRRFSDLAAAEPHGELCSTGFCLAHPGHDYLVLQPAAETPFTVNLLAGRYRLEWFRPDTAKAEKTGEMQTGDGPQKFKAPFAGPAVLYLTVDPAGK